MQSFLPVILDVWREACRHIEVERSVAQMAPLLMDRLPLEQVVMRRFELARSSLDTVALATRTPRTGGTARGDLSSDALEALLAWGRRGVVAHESARALRRRLPGLLGEEAQGDVLAGPLRSEDDVTGVLLLVARRSQRFDARHAELARALLEPFSVALENDRRLREMASLREAAEADRRSLLSRLGRTDLGDTIVGASSGLRGVMDRVDRVAAIDVPVLLLGETGSGKEVIARAIHMRSRRASGPFLRVNCGAIPPGLIDSELFGHERGSFTGATAERRGWFERASGGTLFLDELGELSRDAQVRLLRVVQDGSLERVGGHRSIGVDVRIVAATHRDLAAMVRERSFREDLWYRIAVFPIQLPALRERPEDVPALATHFALRAATRFGTPPLVPTPEDLDLLVRYPWPGNVREIGAVMERAVILGDGRRLAVARALGPMPEPPAAPPFATVIGAEPRKAPELAGGPLAVAAQPGERLDAAIARHIEAALTKTHGRIEGPFGAATLLDINPHTLRARMRKLGLDWKRFRTRPSNRG